MCKCYVICDDKKIAEEAYKNCNVKNHDCICVFDTGQSIDKCRATNHSCGCSIRGGSQICKSLNEDTHKCICEQYGGDNESCKAKIHLSFTERISDLKLILN